MFIQFQTIFLLIFLVNPIYSQSKTHQTIADLEQQRFLAMMQKDVAFLENVLTEDVTYAHSNGLVENKKQHLENVSSGSITYQQMKVEENSLRIYKKTAVNNGIINVKGLYKGTPFQVRLGYTNIYVKTKRQWKLAAWQSAKLEE
ncbi:MAG: nuclear transport factor 2 family protein [Bacteroidota bacterium]